MAHWGGAPKSFQGIEVRDGCPILYAAGDLVDDYYVDPAFRNDHQLLFELELEGASLRRILLHPVFIAQCRTSPADPAQAAWIGRQMGALCSELGTRLDTGSRPWTMTPA